MEVDVHQVVEVLRNVGAKGKAQILVSSLDCVAGVKRTVLHFANGVLDSVLLASALQQLL